MIPRLVNTLLGVWLMAAPAALGHGDGGVAAANGRIVGPLVASAAIVAMWPETRPVRHVNVVLGGWLVVAPLLLRLFTDYPGTATVNSVVVGVAVILLARVRGPLEDEFRGGWRSIWRSDIDTTDPGAVRR